MSSAVTGCQISSLYNFVTSCSAAFTEARLSRHSLLLHCDSKLDSSPVLHLSPLSALDKGAIKALSSARQAPWLLLSPTARQQGTTIQTSAIHTVQPTMCRLQVFVQGQQDMSKINVAITTQNFVKRTLEVK